jgi:hypothetical protein
MSKKIIYTLPKLYESEELNIKLAQLYDNIKITLVECIINDPFEFGFMKDFGLTPRQQVAINYSLDKQLNELTNNKYNRWCDHINFMIINGIEGSLSSLQKLNKINNFTPEEMVDFIYNNIVYQIDDFEHSPCLSEDLLKDINAEDK